MSEQEAPSMGNIPFDELPPRPINYSKLRDFAAAIFYFTLAGAILFWSYKLYGQRDRYNRDAAFADQIFQKADQAVVRINKMATAGDGAMKKLDDASTQQIVFINEQEEDYKKNKGQFTTDIHSLLNTTTHSVGTLDLFVQDLKDKRVPDITSKAIATIGDLGEVATTTNTAMGNISSTTKHIDEQFEQATHSDIGKRIIANLDKFSGNLATISDTTAKDLPVFFTNTNETAKNVAGITKQINIAVENFNKPLSFKQKVERAGEDFIFRGIPIAVPLLLKK